MGITEILNIAVPIVFIGVGIALIFFIVELIKMIKTTNSTVVEMKEKINPLLDNAETMTNDIVPAVAKIDPLMDRVQLTVDSLNLEMMRVDQILEDVSEITDSASSATAAVDNITSAPLKAVNNVASRFKSALGGKDASQESEQLAEQRVAVAQALEEFKAAEEKEAARREEAESDAPAAAEASLKATEEAVEASSADAPAEDAPHMEIDPNVIAESLFFEDDPAEE